MDRPTLTKYRKNLLKGNRCDSPCTECNAEGTVLGKSHAEEWKKFTIIKISQICLEKLNYCAGYGIVVK